MVAAVVSCAYAVPILNPDLPSWLVELYRSLSWSPGVLHHRLRVRIFLADERLRYLVRDLDDRDCPTSGPAAAAARLIPLLSVLNWRVRIRPRGRVAIYMAGWPGRDLCGRVAPPLLAFCAALAVLDVERSETGAIIAIATKGRLGLKRPEPDADLK